MDPDSGLTFSLSHGKLGKFIIEVSHFELAARFLKAFADGTISRTLTRAFFPEQPVVFSKLEKVECYTPIRDTIQQYAFDLSPNKIYQQCFVKFLYRHVQFFTSTYYCYNERIKNFGSTVMRQMIEEARSLVQIDFTTENYRKVYLLYDPNFPLKLLHADWNTKHIKKLQMKLNLLQQKVLLINYFIYMNENLCACH
ncbi:unnamed protein product [Didymodactylos carnosus]|uniref:Uncharacterized protein n=1 Tax=Didymodactylos carnosus TaxID=1234261 RepID=A0A8S2F0T1_9BILA|nr:unnamed protein product [Didymodactylos carnosus]CAF4099281.1 unnamed protein product [Didymodactylos carnosus]